ncbi:hypothetical protein AKJ13_15890 [Methylobacterium sp. ARG-1]|nr:hypothetical protein AKJ13_15890 [Methylobacterium sp. ARG-1]
MSAASCISGPSSSPMFTASGNDMRKSGSSDTQGWVIEPQRWVAQWRQIHPVKAAQCVAEAINAPARTVEKWFSGEAKPSLDYVGPILNRYGLAFVVGAMANPVPWLDDLAREERKLKLLAERRAIDEMLAEDFRRASR